MSNKQLPDSDSGSEFSTDELKAFLQQYSVDDIARSLFVFNLWLPNIASPIKFEYLYSCFESLAGILGHEAKIKSYNDFAGFCKKLIQITPSFPMLEDYIPESDWGEIKYFFKRKFYRIFYGANLSNQYDFSYAFEVIQCTFDKEYVQLTGRSPVGEFEFCLKLQDHILQNFVQTTTSDDRIRPGYIEIPAEDFWNQANDFITSIMGGGTFDRRLMDSYSLVVNAGSNTQWPEMQRFVDQTFDGRNCFYYFIKSGNLYYPVMPRRYFSILYDTWGDLLRKYFNDIALLDKYADRTPMVELAKFMRERIDGKSFFGVVSPLDATSKPVDFLFAGAIHSGDRLILVNLAPISKVLTNFESYLESLVPTYDNIALLLMNDPPRLAMPLEETGVEFKNSTLHPIFLTVVPYTTSGMRTFRIPENLKGDVFAIDQFLGIIDELETSDEFGEFLDYCDKLKSATKIQPLTSILDLFGSFRDSHSVLIEGATTPNFMMIDPNWGSNYRFKNLKEFWANYPEVSFLGHPRSWRFVEDAPPNVMKSRSKRAFAHFETIERCTFILNCPFHLMKVEQLLVTDTLLQMLRDALSLYKDSLARMPILAQYTFVQVLCIPSYLVRTEEKLAHLRHLIPEESLWTTDLVKIASGDLRICIVFDEERLSSLLLKAQDRSIQIDLLIEVLECVQRSSPDPKSAEIVDSLIAERAKECRFKLFERKKDVSFPEHVVNVELEAKHFKLADKSIAETASKLSITPSEHQSANAKVAINALIHALVQFVNDQVKRFDLKQALPIIVTNADALVHRFESGEFQIKASTEHEVEFDRTDALHKDKTEFYHDHQGYRYLIEKFVQLSPFGQSRLESEDLAQLLALVERLLNLYAASDAIHYGMFPATLTIRDDFKAEVKYGVDISAMQKEFGIEQTRIELGEIGNREDSPSQPLPVESFLPQLDAAFKGDFGFSLRNLMTVLVVLGRWAEYSGEEERGYYSALLAEITATCAKNITDFDSTQTEKILDFLTLKQDEILHLVLERGVEEANDIPVWEYSKRRAKYLLKPALKYDGKYHWGPYSTNRAAKIWSAVAGRYKLPLALPAPSTERFLTKTHQQYENAHEQLILSIVARHSEFVKPGVFPHKIDGSIQDIGDCDVFAYLPDNGIVLNIEAKIIDPAFCMKDTQRISNKIFGRTRGSGEFEEGYLQSVERRHRYLEKGYQIIMSDLGWIVPPKAPRIVSLLVTQMAFWWTKFPPISTEVHFVESRLLDEFIKTLKSDKLTH